MYIPASSGKILKHLRIDEIVGWFALKDAEDILGGSDGGADESLVCLAGDVGRAEEVFELNERIIVRNRFLFENVQCGGGDFSLAERFVESLFIDEPSSGCVHQDG